MNDQTFKQSILTFEKSRMKMSHMSIIHNIRLIWYGIINPCPAHLWDVLTFQKQL